MSCFRRNACVSSPPLTVAMILAIALYFTLFWGFDALRVLTLADLRPGRCLALAIHFRHRQPASASGRSGLIKLAAFFGALKLAVAAICALHILDRCRALVGGKAEFRNSRRRPDPGRDDQHHVGRPGGLVAKRRTGARRDHPAVARRHRRRRSAWSSAAIAASDAEPAVSLEMPTAHALASRTLVRAVPLTDR